MYPADKAFPRTRHSFCCDVDRGTVAKRRLPGLCTGVRHLAHKTFPRHGGHDVAESVDKGVVALEDDRPLLKSSLSSQSSLS